MMKIGVLGAGNGGQAFAGGLTLKGHDVHLAATPGHDTQIKILKTFGGVTVDGMTAAGIDGGFAPIKQIDTDVGAAVREAEVLLLAVPAYAQETYFDAIAEQAPDGQLVVMEPGKFGALRLAERIREAGRDPNDLLIAETSSFLYAAKIRGLDHIWLRGVKKQLPLAAYPACRTAEALDRLRAVHEQYVAAPNVLATSMDDASYALHSVTTLLNLSRLEAMGPYRTNHYDITPQTARMVEAVDGERCAVAAAYGVETHSILQQLEVMYGLSDGGLYERMTSSTVHRDQMSPNGANHRYITEEVPYGLVPLLQLGAAAGMRMPATEAVVTLASVVTGEDYRKTGRNLAALGLGARSPEEIVAICEGKTPVPPIAAASEFSNLSFADGRPAAAGRA